MARIDIRNLGKDRVKVLAKQIDIYGNIGRKNYLKLLILIDTKTNIVSKIIKENNINIIDYIEKIEETDSREPVQFRISIIDIQSSDIALIEKQIMKLNLRNRTDYIKLLIDLDVMGYVLEILSKKV